jgi:hypothetical protein
MAGRRLRRIRFGVGVLSLAAVLSCGQWGLAQSQEATGGAAPLTADERRAAESAAVADSRGRAIVGAEKPRVITADVETDKTEAEAYLAGTSEKLPARRVTIVLFDVKTGQAASVLVSLTEYRVLSVQRIPASDVPFAREDADDALALAKADSAVRRAVGEPLDRFEIVDSGADPRVPFAAQALPLRGTDPKDPCRVDRCLDLVFRTERGYLPVRAHVDLTKRTVTVTRREGKHP